MGKLIFRHIDRDKKQIIKSYGALVFRSKEDTYDVLLMRRSDFYLTWSVPTRTIEGNETEKECARRAVLDETNIHAKLLVQYPETEFEKTYTIDQCTLWTAEEPYEQEIITSDKTTAKEIQWFDVRKLPTLYQLQRKTIKQMIIDHLNIVDIKDCEEAIISKQIVEQMLFLSETFKTDDWLTLKRHIIQASPVKIRKLFSKRHFSTNLQMINEFERNLINQWEALTGSKLILRRVHDEQEYQAKKAAEEANRSVRYSFGRRR